MSEYKAFVAENLGGESERYAWYELEEMENMEFSPLNIVILKKTSDVRTWSFGIDDEEFHQRKPEKGLITKKEVRILSLNEMKLTQKSMFGILVPVLVRWRLRLAYSQKKDRFLRLKKMITI